MSLVLGRQPKSRCKNSPRIPNLLSRNPKNYRIVRSERHEHADAPYPLALLMPGMKATGTTVSKPWRPSQTNPAKY
jgi:hypothetical protein